MGKAFPIAISPPSTGRRKEKPRVNYRASELYTDANGYYRIKATNQLLHRVIYSYYNPNFDRRWHIHHCNRKKKDNRIQNLIALPKFVHFRLHDIYRLKLCMPSKKLVNRFLQHWISKGLDYQLAPLRKEDRRQKRKRHKRQQQFQKNRDLRHYTPPKPTISRVLLRSAGGARSPRDSAPSAQWLAARDRFLNPKPK